MPEVPLTPEAAQALFERLPSMDADEQLAALEQLIHVPDPTLRRRVLGMGSALFSEDRLVDLLRDEADDVRRNAGVEMLKLRRQRAYRIASHLLEDDDPDVALQAVLILSHIRDLRALETLRTRALGHADPNVAQEAIVALGRLRYARAVEDLIPRMDEDFWIASAAVEALGQIGSSAAVPYLERLLGDVVIGPFAAEALARIGGVAAFVALARHWVRHQHEMDTGLTLRRLAHLLGNLTMDPPEVKGLEMALRSRCSEEERKEIRVLALQCLASIGGRNRPLAMS